MTRVLSLLLLIPFLVTQVWAGTGGPFDGAMGNSQTAWAGSYGLSLQGNEDAGVDAISTTGVLSLSIPLSGLTMGRILIFDKGLMYLGSTQGHLDPRSGKLKLLAQASHYTVLASYNNTFNPVVDYILSGQLNLNLSADYFSGLIIANGDATFARYDPIAEALTVRSSTTTTGSTKTNISGIADDGSPVGTTTTVSKSTGESTKEDVVTVTNNPDGSVTTTTKSTTQTDAGPATTLSRGTTSNEGVTSNVAVQATDPNEVHRVTPVTDVSTVKGSDTVTMTSTASLRPGMTISGPGIENGTTVIRVIDGNNVQLSKPASATASNVTLTSNPSSIIFLTMTVEGLRQDTAVSPLPIFASPTQTTYFQIGVTAGGAAGGAVGAPATGG